MMFTFALAAMALGQTNACPPEHAAMGHCKPQSAAAEPNKPPKPQPDSSPDPACPPEHAAMGHCKPRSETDQSDLPQVSQPSSPAASSCPPEHAAMGHCTLAAPTTGRDEPAAHNQASGQMGQDPNCPPEHAQMGHCTPKAAAGTVALPAVAPPPAAAFSGPENAADTVYDPALMASKRRSSLIAEHGGMTTSRILIDRLELLARKGRDGYAWEGDAWVGGDYDKLWLKSEGEGEVGGQLEAAEVQALWSRAIFPFFDFQAGVRYDVRPRPDRTYLTVGIQGLAPYWFEVDAAAFISTKGDLTARFEAEYDQRITNRVIIQPRLEFDLSAQDVPELGIGSGLSSAELGLRLRYQFVPEFAPYIGVGYERRFGDTARLAREEGEDVGGWSFLIGLRAWF